MINKKSTFTDYISCKGKTLKDVAKLLGISYNSILNKVNNKADFSQRELQIIRESLLQNQPLIFDECFMHCYSVCGFKPVYFFVQETGETKTIKKLIQETLLKLNEMEKSIKSYPRDSPRPKDNPPDFLIASKERTRGELDGLIFAYNAITAASMWLTSYSENEITMIRNLCYIDPKEE